MAIFDVVRPIGRDAAEAAFASGDEDQVCHALVSIAFHDQEWRWIQEKCLIFLQNENPEVSGLAATCLGHVARIHGQLDKDRVVAALHEKLDDGRISGRVEDALDDIEFFLSR